MIWETWKKGFGAGEGATAKVLEGVLKSPLFLEPTGALIATVAKVRGASHRVQNAWLGSLGLATKRDQERTLHLLHELESRMYDLQERLDRNSESQKQDGG
jgi:hypothetical protein